MVKRKKKQDQKTAAGYLNQPLPSGTKLPTGTVTFLFTDIVGSTPHWEQKPEKMAEALRVHNHSLREAIEGNGGVVFKTVGDAFQASFPTALQALKAAVAGQQALQNAGWNELGELKVRMGLHTGEAEMDPGGDEYAVSHTKNRVARIMSAAHGGQILLSAETKELIGHYLQDGVTLKYLGEHRLKGMQWLEQLYQVCASGLPEDFPPLSSTIIHPNNLPRELTSFIGREKEIARVQELLNQNRMVTLTGVGGTGKTRLSLHVARLILGDYPQGGWFVELAGLSDPAMVPRTVASALNLPEIAGKPVAESLVSFLREKRLLLIFDNCEHLLEACTDLAGHLLRSCPDLTILASSREFLGVTGEVPYRLPPMALPDIHHETTAILLAEYDAVCLFVERARVVAQDFAVTSDNAAAVVQVVNRLDGIPLAIELAAARLRLLSVEQIARRLDDAFRLLTGGSRSALPRHQTLRASIDWSYNLLSERERVLLRRLSVFSGSWRMRAAEQVCADPPGPGAIIHTDEILDLVSGLLDKSLIQTISGADRLNRFRMLETVRQYAHEKLVDEGESEAARDRHLAYYLKWVEEAAPKIRGREQVQTLDQLEGELDNLRLSLEWALRTDVEAELKMSAALIWFWYIRSHSAEGIEWLGRGLDRVETDPKLSSAIDPLVRARAMVVLGYFHWLQVYEVSTQVVYNPERAKNLFTGAITLYQTLDPERNQEARLGLAWANLWLGFQLNDVEGEPEQARILAQGAMETFQAAGDLFGMAECLQLLAFNSLSPEQTYRLHQGQLSIYEKMMDLHGIAKTHGYIGLAVGHIGEYASELESFKASLRYARLVMDSNTIHNAGFMVGANLLALGEFSEAENYFQQALVGWREMGLDNRVVWSMHAIAQLRMAQGRYEQAAEVIEQTGEFARSTGIDASIVFALTLRSRLARLQGDLTQALNHLKALPASGFTPYYQKIVIPLGWGSLALQTGDLAQAGSRLREALTFLDNSYHMYLPPFFDGAATYAARMGMMEAAAQLFGSRWGRCYENFLSPIEKAWRENDWTAIRAELGKERFKALYEESISMTYEQIVALAQEVLEV